MPGNVPCVLGEDRISEARAVGSEPARERPIASRPSLLLACECSSIVNFAMEQNGVPIVHEVAVRNEGPAAVAGAVIEVESGPGLSELLSLPVPELKPGQEHRVSPVDIRLLPGRLRAVVEAERGEIRCRVVRGGVTLAERRNDVRILAFNEWPGQEAPPGLLASFVLPNHPAVATLLQGVRTNLVSAGLSDALDGYQGGGRERVREQAKALYAAVQSLGIGYVVAPPSFEVSGQKIRLPDAVLKDRLGCCLDLSVLFAAALELMGIAPVLVLLRGHAFVAAWLTDDRFSSGVIDDVARLRTQAQSGNLLLLETTAVTRAQPVAFESAFESAYQRLGDDAAFEWAVDVRALRTEYRPLSIRASPGPDAGELLPEAGAAPARSTLWAVKPEGPTELEQPKSAPSDIDVRFRRWKEKLLDLTLRNRLLNFQSGAKGALQLEVPDLQLLEGGVSAGHSFELLPFPDSGARDTRNAYLAERRTQDVADAVRLADLRRFRIHVRHDTADLWARARHLDRAARTALEEGGAGVLHLAIGFLRWFESGVAGEPRHAPLLLYPVELSFDARARRARMRRLADDPILNVTLVEKLRRDCAVDVTGLESLAAADLTSDGIAIPELARRFRDAIQHIPRWEVREEAHLGIFHFTKFLMWKDLDDNAQRFLDNPVVRRIASREPVSLQQNASIQPEHVDDIHPSRLPTVLDADSTQQAAIASAVDGQSFVLQGPPGTGKSQTIANIIAAVLAERRSVLFVSEKMAALEVVHGRLRQAGLADFCLELHSHKTNKREVVASLKAALEHAPRPTPDGDWQERGDALLAARRLLDAYAEALHRPGSLGKSVYEVRDRTLELAATPDERISSAAVGALDADAFARLQRSAEELAGIAAAVEPTAQHPFREARRAEWSAVAEQELAGALAQVRQDVRAWDDARDQLATRLGATGLTSAVAEDAARAAAAVALGPVPGPAATPDWPDCSARARCCVRDRKAAAACRADLEARWRTSFFEVVPEVFIRRFERWATAFFVFAWIMLFTARRQLRQHARTGLARNTDVLCDLRVLSALASDRARMDEEAIWTGTLLGTAPDAATEHWDRALDALDRASPALRRLVGAGADGARVATALSDSMSSDGRAALVAAAESAGIAASALRRSEERFGAILVLSSGTLPGWERPGHCAALLSLVNRCEVGIRQFRTWCLYRGAADALSRAGAPELAEAHLEGRVLAEQLPAVLEKAVLRTWHANAVDADPALRDFNAGKQSGRVARFREIDRAHLAASRVHVIGRLEEQLPSIAAADLVTSEPALIMREAHKKARHLPIRRLLREIAGILPRLKPCFLMSPLSVAQYLPPDAKPFDLVVFDEASQICTHEAIGAIARGRQVIIVGDSRQMPPTRFFSRGDHDELPGDEDLVELESILDEAVAKLIPQQWLGWHYRSRHQSLIEFSNRHIYDGRLDVFPAPRLPSPDLGVEWRRVNGVYEGGSGSAGRTNRIEAEALVAHLLERLRRFEPGERTFGVVTFSIPQQQLVLDLLDDARIDPDVDRHFTGPEGTFVKNLESVQGDERDEILFSICFAPDAGGRFRMHYGPLSVAGGERRLNVAVTRARQKLMVFSSIDPEQIDRSRTGARGAWLLREFLKHARDGGRVPCSAVGTSRAPQLQAIVDALRREGLEVEVDVGCSKYALDIAVRHPAAQGQYAVGIECDGSTYRSARSTRDRDRLRADVLHSMGWNLERVWSNAWWFDPDAPAALVAAVRKALAMEPPRALARREAPEVAVAGQVASSQPSAGAVPDGVAGTGAAHAPAGSGRYESAALDPADSGRFCAPSSTGGIRQQIIEVVEREGPIHEALLARRIAAAWGIERITANLTRRVGSQLEDLRAAGQVRRLGKFLWPMCLEPTEYRGYRAAAEDSAREIHLIAPEEIANAAAAVLHDAGSMDRSALGREVARRFGVCRVGGRVREILERGIEVLVASRRCEVIGERIQVAGAGGPVGTDGQS